MKLNLKLLPLALLFSFATVLHADTLNKATNAKEFMGTLFSGAEQYSNFYRTEELLPSQKVAKSSQPVAWPEGKAVTLPQHYTYNGKQLPTQALLEETDTAALLVIKDGKIRYENYRLTGSRDRHWMSMSVAKSVVSALMGIAVAEGKIKSIEDTAVTYVPALKGSAYENVRIKDILQMSSGARWLEEYGNPDSEIARLGQAMVSGSSLVEFVSKIQNELKPGTFNRYNSADTQVLGLVLEAATGKSMAAYTQEKLWGPLGATHDAYWNTDNDGNAMAFSGFNATARDYARVGELFRLKGQFNGKQIVPASWVKASVTPDAPHLMPGKRDNSDASMGYGYQWWIPEGEQQDFSAIGILNQFVYVSPKHDTVIVKLSASRNYASAGDESSWRENETIELFRQIAQSID
jgi:CubicO group peptidase (beta-lactamase class C family)